MLKRGWGENDENEQLVGEGKRGPEVSKVVISIPPMVGSNSMIV